VDKFDPSYGQIIEENQVLRMICYPTMVAVHDFLVKTVSGNFVILYFSFQWILTHFFPKISSLLAKLIDQVVILVFGSHFDTSSNSHMAKYVFDLSFQKFVPKIIGTLASSTSPSMERTP
jgi:hypothetical protein